jgi:hypothetical protein
MHFSSASLSMLQETGMTPTEPCLFDLDSVPCQGWPLAMLAGTPVYSLSSLPSRQSNKPSIKISLWLFSFRFDFRTVQVRRGLLFWQSPTRALWQTNAVAPHVFLRQLKQFQFNIPNEYRDLTGIRFCFTSLFALPVRVRKSLSNGSRYIENTKEWKSSTSAKSRLSP